MTLFFLISLIASLVLAVCLFALLIYQLQINWTGQNKRGISYLLPVVSAVLFALFVALDTGPKLLDLVNIWQQNVKSVQLSGSEIKVQKNRYYVAGETYLTSFPGEKVKADASYSIVYLPNTKIIVKFEAVDTLPEGDEGKEKAGEIRESIQETNKVR